MRSFDLLIKFILLGFLILIVFLFPSFSHAFTFKSGNTAQIPQNQTVDGSLFISASSVEIDGTVNGDVFCAAQRIRINGTINGDLICVGQNYTINGTINGNVRVAGQSINLGSRVERNTTILGQNVSIDNSANISGELVTLAQSVDLIGAVGKSVYVAGQDVEVRNNIGGNLDIKAENISVNEQASIQGKLTYTSENKAAIASGARINGGITQITPPKKEKEPQKTFTEILIGNIIFSILSGLVLGALIIMLWPLKVKEIVTKMDIAPLPSVGWGIVVMFISPILAFLFFLTIIGIPAAFVILLLWLTALITSWIFIALLIGKKVLGWAWRKKTPSLFFMLLIGVPIAAIIFSIPFIGWFLMLIGIWWGLGGIFEAFRTNRYLRER